MERFTKKCDECGQGMNTGYVVELYDLHHYCSDECLYNNITKKYYLQAYADDSAYYTEWEEHEEDEFFLADGTRVEVEPVV